MGATPGPLAARHVQVAVAHAGGVDADERVARPGVRDGEVLDHQGTVFESHRLHGRDFKTLDFPASTVLACAAMDASDRARDEIAAIVHGYAELLDGGDVEACRGDVLAGDLAVGGHRHGAAHARGAARASTRRSSLPTDPIRTRHLMHNLVISHRDGADAPPRRRAMQLHRPRRRRSRRARAHPRRRSLRGSLRRDARRLVPHRPALPPRSGRDAARARGGGVVKFGFAVPAYGKAVDGGIAELVDAGEELGFDSVWWPDHIAVPDYADRGEPADAVPRTAGRVRVGTRSHDAPALRHRRARRAVPPPARGGGDDRHDGRAGGRSPRARRRHRLPARRVRRARRRLRRARRDHRGVPAHAARAARGLLGDPGADTRADVGGRQQPACAPTRRAARRRLAPVVAPARRVRRRPRRDPRHPARRRARRRRSRSRSAPAPPASPTCPTVAGRRRRRVRPRARSSATRRSSGWRPTAGRGWWDHPTT